MSTSTHPEQVTKLSGAVRQITYEVATGVIIATGEELVYDVADPHDPFYPGIEGTLSALTNELSERNEYDAVVMHPGAGRVGVRLVVTMRTVKVTGKPSPLTSTGNQVVPTIAVTDIDLSAADIVPA